jgi:hypothetical protein
MTMVKKVNFFFEFFEKTSILPFYERINNNTNGNISVNKNNTQLGKLADRVFVVNFIPPYLDLKINKEKTPYRAFQVKPRTGFIIDLSQYSSADEYLKSHLGSKNRRNILSRLKRLESCFNINYKIYFGEMDKSEYAFLFEKFERMIGSRFEQRGDEHVGFQRWDEYKESVYELIIKKRASLFVIYDNDKPIAINLNYHFENILDIAIPSYDIDYFKFGLGQIALVKQLEWCFENDYKRVDMRWGELPYKRLWCNAIMNYKCDVVYNKNNPIDMLIAFLVAKGVNIKKSLTDRKILPLNLNFTSRGTENTKPNNKVDSIPAYTIEDLEELPLNEVLSLIDLNDKEFQFLRNPVYNYQYSHTLHSKDLKIYSVNSQNMTYIIEGNSKLHKLIL